MHNARIRWLTVLWLFLPWLVLAQPPPALVRSVLTTNLPAFGSAGQVLTRQAGIPYLLWLPPSGDLVLSNYVTAISNLLWQSDNMVSNWVNSVSNSVNSKTNFIVTTHNYLFASNSVYIGTTQHGLTHPLTISGIDPPWFGSREPAVGGMRLESVADTNFNIQIGVNNQQGWGFVQVGEDDITTPFPGPYTPTYSNLWLNPFGGDVIIPNNLSVSGIITNSSFIKSQTGFGTNTSFLSSANTTVPLVISNQIGSTTNSLEIPGTNGTEKGKDFVVTSGGKVGIGTNLPQALLHVRGTNGPSQYIVQVENPMVANASNLLVVKTNNCVGILNSAPTRALDVTGTIAASASLSAGQAVTLGGTFTLGWGSSTKMLAPSDGYMSIRADNATNFFGLVLGTNSTSGTNMPAFRTFGTGFSNTPLPTIRVVSQDGIGPANLEVSGTLGVGTNIVQKGDVTWPKLIITADNSAANVAQFGTTNKPSQVTLSTNGVLSVNPGGGLNPVGCWGALMNNTSNTVVCPGAAGVYTNICGTGFTTMYTNGFYGNVSAIVAGLTNLYAGYYRVDISCSYLGANSSTYEFDVTTNGVICALVEVKNTTDNPARFRSASCGGLIYLPANTGVQMMVQDQGNGTTVNVFRSALRIGTP